VVLAAQAVVAVVLLVVVLEIQLEAQELHLQSRVIRVAVLLMPQMVQVVAVVALAVMVGVQAANTMLLQEVLAVVVHLSP
jgi:hypothetical protein